MPTHNVYFQLPHHTVSTRQLHTRDPGEVAMVLLNEAEDGTLEAGWWVVGGSWWLVGGVGGRGILG